MDWSLLPCFSFSFRSPLRNCSQPPSWEFCPCLPEIIALSILFLMSYSHSVILARTLEIRFSEIYGNNSYFIIWFKRKSFMIHEGFLVLFRVDFMHRKLLISKKSRFYLLKWQIQNCNSFKEILGSLCDNMDGSWKHYVKWNESEEDKYCAYMWNLKIDTPQTYRKRGHICGSQNEAGGRGIGVVIIVKYSYRYEINKAWGVDVQSGDLGSHEYMICKKAVITHLKPDILECEVK